MSKLHYVILNKINQLCEGGRHKSTPNEFIKLLEVIKETFKNGLSFLINLADFFNLNFKSYNDALIGSLNK